MNNIICRIDLFIYFVFMFSYNLSDLLDDAQSDNSVHFLEELGKQGGEMQMLLDIL